MRPHDNSQDTYAEVDTALFRDAMARFPTGVTIVTSLDERRQPCGMTVSAFMSVSLDPALVLVSLSNSSNTLRAIEQFGIFAVNVLAADQEDLAWLFAQPDKDRFRRAAWTTGMSGLPLVDEAATHMECRTVNRVVAGDHVLVVGQVAGIGISAAEALVHYRRTFRIALEPSSHLLKMERHRA